MSLKPRTLAQRGDTIVEVLIVLAVLGFALTLSYSTATRSLRNIRQAQENAEATALAQSQVEALRTMTTPGYAGPTIFQSGPYCVKISMNPYLVAIPPNSSCSANPLYSVQITYVPVPPSIPPTPPVVGGTFTVLVTWPDVGGEGNDTVSAVYRLYQ